MVRKKKDKFNIFILTAISKLLSIFKINFQFNFIITELCRNIVVNINNVKFTLIDYESLSIVTPKFEQWMAKYITLKNGNTFLDVGAHIGKYTIQAAKMVGDKGMVISIEPHPLNYKVLNKNILLNQLGNVKTYNIAGWNEKRRLKIYEGTTSGRHSCKKNLQIYLGNMSPKRASFNISAKPIDDIIKALKVNINMIKIDAGGGAEFEILQGLKQTLLTHRPVVLVEILKNNQNKTLSFLNQLGYRVIKTPSSEDFVAYPQKSLR